MGAIRIGMAGAAVLLLGGCGGGSGGGPSLTPAPIATPTPTPAPANTTITDLRASQSFANDGARMDVSFNLTSRTTIAARAAGGPVTVAYDAGSNSYTVTGGGIAEAFGPADRQAGGVTGETRYIRRGDGQASYLTLVTTPYTGPTTNRYVALGFRQRNTVSASGDRQDTDFTTFAYGLDTPAGAVPRTGTGTFNTDVFGLESVPGSEPNTFQGHGRFDVDFVNGRFSTSTYLTRTGLISGNSVVGGGLDLTGGGRLTSGTGGFAGDVVYSASGLQIGGQLTGRFYGPEAQEIGAGFAGQLADGSAFTGALTGQRDQSLQPANISFARLVAPQLFYADATTLTVRTPRNGGTPSVSDYPGSLGPSVSRSQFNDKTSGNVSFGPPNSLLPGGDYTVTAIVPGAANFTTYDRTFAGQPTRLELYRTGADNTELQLTYASFGRYTTASDADPFQTTADRVFFVYGFGTPSGLLANRTGTASYAGVAYGAGADAAGTIRDVTGTARLSVDFGAQSLTGQLQLAGKGTADTIDYGAYALSGRLFSYGSTATAQVARAGGAGTSVGSALVNFYGPSAEEAGGLFRLRVPDGAGAGTLITGAAVTKRQ